MGSEMCIRDRPEGVVVEDDRIHDIRLPPVAVGAARRAVARAVIDSLKPPHQVLNVSRYRADPPLVVLVDVGNSRGVSRGPTFSYFG